MHAWLSLEVFAASFTTSGGFCAGAALAKEKRRNPRIVAEWRLLIAPPGLAPGLSKVMAKRGRDPRIAVAPILGSSSGGNLLPGHLDLPRFYGLKVLRQPVKKTSRNAARSEHLGEELLHPEALDLLSVAGACPHCRF